MYRLRCDAIQIFSANCVEVAARWSEGSADVQVRWVAEPSQQHARAYLRSLSGPTVSAEARQESSICPRPSAPENNKISVYIVEMGDSRMYASFRHTSKAERAGVFACPPPPPLSQVVVILSASQPIFAGRYHVTLTFTRNASTKVPPTTAWRSL